MTKIPNCRSCIHAVTIAGKKGLQCGHGSAMGRHSIVEARRRPRWVELLSFRGLCGAAGTFFEKKPRNAREKKEEKLELLMLMTESPSSAEGSNE